MDSHLALILISKILSVLAIVQGVEFLYLAPVYAKTGVWKWSTLEPELAGQNPVLKTFFKLTLEKTSFKLINIARILIALSLLVFPYPGAVIGLLAIHILTLLRWRGTFNGGSDYMNLLLLLCLSIGLLGAYSNQIVDGCLWYISIQLCLSYFKAGIIKLKNAQWKTGVALSEFLQSSMYEKNKIVNWMITNKTALLFSSWAVIIFEVTFPLALLNSNFAITYILFGIVFHLGNIYMFGLNRFLLAWAAAYPALLWAAT